MLKNKKGQMQSAGVIGFIAFAVLVVVALVVYAQFDTAARATAVTTIARAARGNVTKNTFAAFQLVAVGPIIFGAVIILGIVGLLMIGRR